MAYRNFKLADLQQKFGLTIQRQALFNTNQLLAVAPSNWLVSSLTKNKNTNCPLFTEQLHRATLGCFCN